MCKMFFLQSHSSRLTSPSMRIFSFYRLFLSLKPFTYIPASGYPQSLSISRKISRKTAGGRGRLGLLWCLFETLSFYHLIPQIPIILAEQSKSFRNGFGLFF